MSKFLIQKYLSRDSEWSLEGQWSDSRAEAVRIMKEFADGGQFYAAVFIGEGPDAGECIEETEDVDV